MFGKRKPKRPEGWPWSAGGFTTEGEFTHVQMSITHFQVANNLMMYCIGEYTKASSYLANGDWGSALECLERLRKNNIQLKAMISETGKMISRAESKKKSQEQKKADSTKKGSGNTK